MVAKGIAVVVQMLAYGTLGIANVADRVAIVVVAVAQCRTLCMAAAALADLGRRTGGVCHIVPKGRTLGMTAYGTGGRCRAGGCCRLIVCGICRAKAICIAARKLPSTQAVSVALAVKMPMQRSAENKSAVVRIKQIRFFIVFLLMILWVVVCGFADRCRCQTIPRLV